MAAHKERLVIPGAFDPAPAGSSGYGMVHLREIHHIDAPPRSRQSFWHSFSSPDEVSDFLDAQSHARTSGGQPVLAMRPEQGRSTGTAAKMLRTLWSALTHRHQSLLKRLSHSNPHRDLPRRFARR